MLQNHEAEIEDIFKAHDELENKYNEEVREKKVKDCLLFICNM